LREPWIIDQWRCGMNRRDGSAETNDVCHVVETASRLRRIDKMQRNQTGQAGLACLNYVKIVESKLPRVRRDEWAFIIRWLSILAAIAFAEHLKPHLLEVRRAAAEILSARQIAERRR